MWKFIAFIVIVYLIFRYIKENKEAKQKINKKSTPRAKNSKLQHYKEKGLNDKDIEVFRATMKTTRDNIMYWESQVDKYEKLMVIEEQTHGLNSSKMIFQKIVQEPSEMNKESEFLYRDLPNMVTLIKKYIELNAVKSNSEEVKLELVERLHYIMKLSERITKNYTDMLIDDVNDLKFSLKDEEKEGEMVE